MDIGIREDLVDLGRDEDGEAVIGSRYYLVAQIKDGRRFAHDYSRINRTRVIDEEGLPCWPYDSGQAIRTIEALRARVQAHLDGGGSIDFVYWNEIDPMYGSEAYSILDEVGTFRDAEQAREQGVV